MSWVRPVVLGLGVPLVLVLLVSLGLEKYEGDWRNALIREFGPIPAEVAAAVRIDALCAVPETAADIAELCREYGLGQVLRTGALLAAAITAGLLLLIAATTRYAGTDRVRLARVFGPTLAIVEIGLVAVILAEGAAATGAAYILESAYLGVIHPQLIFILGLAILVAAAGVVRAILAIARRPTIPVLGIPLERIDEDRLLEFVDDVAAEAGTDPPSLVVAGLDPTFFVVDSRVMVDKRVYDGRMLYLSAPLLRILSRDELRAILAHELGHYIGEDTLYSRRFGPVFRSAVEAFGSVAGSANALSMVALAPSLQILGILIERFATAERAVSRERELEADAVGARVAGAGAIAASLIKLHAYGPVWLDVLDRGVRNLLIHREVGDVGGRLAERVAGGAPVGHLEDLEAVTIAHPTDSHPPLKARLERLGVSYGAIAEAALAGLPASPAAELVSDIVGLEEELVDLQFAPIEQQLETLPARTDPEEPIRELARTEPAVARVVDLFDRARAGDLTRPREYRADWTPLVRLALAPHADPRGFASILPPADLPGGDQLLVVGFAGPADSGDLVLESGERLRPAGINDPAERLQGYEEDFYVAGDRIVAVQAVGAGSMDAQLAGLFIVPKTERLSEPEGPYRPEIDGLAAILAGRPRVTAETDRPAT